MDGCQKSVKLYIFDGCCRDECLSDVFVLNELDFLRLDFDVFEPY